jgi:hypothetical protein
VFYPLLYLVLNSIRVYVYSKNSQKKAPGIMPKPTVLSKAMTLLQEDKTCKFIYTTKVIPQLK